MYYNPVASNNRFRVERYTGTGWSRVGSILDNPSSGIGVAFAFNPSSEIINVTYGTATGLSVIKYDDVYQIQNLPSHLDATTLVDTNVEVGSSNGLLGNQVIKIKHNSELSTILEYSSVDFVDQDLDWGNLVANSNKINKKSIYHEIGPLEGESGIATLYVPRISSDSYVRFCPNAEILSEVDYTCAGGYDITDGATVSGITANAIVKDGADVWELLGTTTGGGISYPPPSPFEYTYDWTRVFAEGNTISNTVNSVSIDSSGNVFSVGGFRGQDVEFDNTSGTDLHSCTLDTYGNYTYTDLFITKYNNDGSYGWTRSYGSGATIFETAYASAVDNNGAIYAGGFFYGANINFDDTGGSDLHSATSRGSAVITKYNNDGSYGWTRTFGSANSEGGVNIALDSNNDVYTIGSFSNLIDFDGTASTDIISPVGNADAFITKYNNDGSYGWTFSIGSSGSNYVSPANIAIDDSNNIYITGGFRETVDFDPGIGTANKTAQSPTENDIFVAKYDSTGNFIWVRTFGAVGTDTASGVAIDGYGDVLISGMINGDTNFDDTGGTDIKGPTSTSDEIFVTKYKSDGSYGWTFLLGGTSIDRVHDITVFDQYTFYLGGVIESTNVDFDATAGSDVRVTNPTELDYSYVSKYGIVTPNPTPTPTSTPIPTVIPTNIPSAIPTVAPTNTPTIIPTSTIIPESTSVPTNTPKPTTVIDIDNQEFFIIDLLSILEAEDENGNNIESDTGLVGNNNVIVRKESTTIPIAKFKSVNFTKDLSWINLNADTDLVERKVFAHLNGTLDGFNDSFTLYVPKNDTDNLLHYCPSAESLSDVTIACSNGFSLLPGQDINGIQVESASINGDSMWLVSGVTGSGAVSYFSEITPTTDINSSPTTNPTAITTPIQVIVSPTVDLSTLPDTGSEGDGFSLLGVNFSDLFSSIGDTLGKFAVPSLPLFGLLPLTGSAIASIISYPRFLLYGFFWFKRIKKNKPWGIVYDLETKKPIQFLNIQLYKNGKYLKQYITDFEGKYGFKVSPGKYEIRVNSQQYNSFTQTLDVENEDVVAVDIGLSPSESQVEFEQSIFGKIKANFGKLNSILVISGALISVIATILSPNLFNFILIAFYIFQGGIILSALILNKKESGRIYNSTNNRSIHGAFVRVYDIEENRQLDVSITDNDGKYYFILDPGEYLIRINAEGYIFPSSNQNIGKLYSSPTGVQFIKATVEKSDSLDLSVALDPIIS